MADTKKLSSIVQIDGDEYSIHAETAKTADKVTNPLVIQGNGVEAAKYDGGTTKTINIKGSGGTSVTTDTNGNITISSTGGDGGVLYLGTVSALTDLSSTARAGDFYRVTTAFVFGSETAHTGDILIATKDNPSQNTTDWDILHAEGVATGGSGGGDGGAANSAETVKVITDSGDKYATITISTNEPNSGAIGDIWFKY